MESTSVATSASEGLRLRPIRIKGLHVPASGDQLFTGSSEELQEEEPMTPAGRLFSDPIFNCHILVIFGLKYSIELEALKDELQKTLLKHKRFCSIVKKDKRGKPYWVPAQVNIDDHIIIPEIEPAQKMLRTFVEDYVAKIAQSPPLDTRQPLWELHVLNATLGGAETNVIFRVHHALGDGTSLMSLFLACTRRVDKPEMLPTIPSRAPKVFAKHQDVTVSESVGKTVFSSLEHLRMLYLKVWKVLLILWYLLLDIGRFLATALWMADSHTAIKGLPGVEFQAKRLVHATVELEDIQMVKRVINGTVNDVLLGLVSAGLTRYLQNCYENGRQESKGKKVENSNPTKGLGTVDKSMISHTRVRASALVNTRASPGLQELQDMMHKGSQARWGNHMGYLILPIPLAVHEDPLEYTRVLQAIGDKKKLSLEGLFTYESGKFLMKIAGTKASAILTYRCTSHTTFSLSNVMGPLEQVQFCGNPIMHIIPTAYGQPQSLCLHFLSYMGKVFIIAFAAKDLIPDPEKLCQFMALTLQEMKYRASITLANK